MSKFEITNELILEKAIEFGLKDVTLFLQDEILKITPRDLDRLPMNNIDRKDGKAPFRSSYYKPVFINGHWYEGVTGNLKKSIIHEQDSDLYFVIGVAKGPALKYARAQEYGGLYNPPRSFIRKGIYDNLNKAKKVFENAVKLYLKNF